MNNSTPLTKNKLRYQVEKLRNSKEKLERQIAADTEWLMTQHMRLISIKEELKRIRLIKREFIKQEKSDSIE